MDSEDITEDDMKRAAVGPNSTSLLIVSNRTLYKGVCKDIFPPKIREYYRSGWVGLGLTWNFLEKHPKIALNQY